MLAETKVFSISIPLIARIKAQQFSSAQSSPSKAKQVYLNTLAVTAVNSYLNCIGWATNLEESDSWNSILQTMMDVADIEIPNYGKLECRVVLPDEDCLVVPPEVWSERIGYIAVELNNSLTEAKLLGFATKVVQTDLPLNQLEALDKLPAHLSLQKRARIDDPQTQLSKWLEGIFEIDWQQLEELFPTSAAINFRNSPAIEHLSTEISRVKLINLEDPQSSIIALIVNVLTQAKEELNISVKVCPTSGDRYLPQGLELVVLDEAKKPIMCAQANDAETIEFCFSAKLGEHFAIEASLDNYIKIENFVI